MKIILRSTIELAAALCGRNRKKEEKKERATPPPALGYPFVFLSPSTKTS